MKPMLAAKLDFSKLKMPVFASPKYDGIRVLIRDGIAFSRALKPLPNAHLQNLARNMPTGLDGEVIVGDPTAKDCMQRTSSGVMSFLGDPDFQFYWFDIWNAPHLPYPSRRLILEQLMPTPTPFHHFAPQVFCVGFAELHMQIEAFAMQGYEGTIVRHADSYYKFGRSTAREGSLLKHKAFEDDEATVIDFEELMHNLNDAEISEVGLQKRSSHKENLVPGNCLGALVVKSDKYPIPFRIGTGFDQHMRYEIWENRKYYMGKLAKFKYQAHGVKDVPRIPVFLGFRDEIDT